MKERFVGKNDGKGTGPEIHVEWVILKWIMGESEKLERILVQES